MSDQRTGDSPRTVVDKIWDEHVVVRGTDEIPDVLNVDLHLIHEVTSPQAFDGLRGRGLRVRRPDQTLATVDHSIPTTDRSLPILDLMAARPGRAASRRTAPSSTSRSTASVRRTRESSTSSVRSWA